MHHDYKIKKIRQIDVQIKLKVRISKGKNGAKVRGSGEVGNISINVNGLL